MTVSRALWVLDPVQVQGPGSILRSPKLHLALAQVKAIRLAEVRKHVPRSANPACPSVRSPPTHPPARPSFENTGLETLSYLVYVHVHLHVDIFVLCMPVFESR